MMRFICLFALALLTTPFTCAAESKLPADAAKLVETFDADAAKIRADAEKAVDKKAAELTGKLQKAQEAAMKRGDLDGANAVKAAIEKAAPKKAVAAAPEATPLGAYKVSKCNWEINEIFLKDKGVVKTSLGDTAAWVITDDTLTITWKDGSASKGEYHPSGINMVSDGKDHCNFWLTKE